ncbi:hypothetical protein AVEN_144783-1 [Araneus ventricosus]|uniref:Uncharacterized protein n=1 Tax=Araneus ventricosus TaxID=182803 RepID=A0A4Y2FFM3_ARAVE|nr:hypothetical protein AVEN_59479-1 [Araneus ventricosus]GBM39115.1 hypothetical protein AVEN_144783-1 [Araneus ventricosus]
MTPRFTGVRPVIGGRPKEPHHHYYIIGMARTCLLISQLLIRELAVPPRWGYMKVDCLPGGLSEETGPICVSLVGKPPAARSLSVSNSQLKRASVYQFLNVNSIARIEPINSFLLFMFFSRFLPFCSLLDLWWSFIFAYS